MQAARGEMSREDEAILRRMTEVAAELEARIADCHNETSCPTCRAPIGVRCRSMPRGYRPLDFDGRVRVLRSPHKQRWTRVVPAR